MPETIRFVSLRKGITYRCDVICPAEERTGERIAAFEIPDNLLPLVRSQETGRIVNRAFIAAYYAKKQDEADVAVCKNNPALTTLVGIVQAEAIKASQLCMDFTLDDLLPGTTVQ